MKRPQLGALLIHPVAIVATCALALNDHALKARFPGLVTGKLSDLAGMIVAPLVLATIADALLPESIVSRPHYTKYRAWLSAAIVAAVFAATKTWAPATHAYELAFEVIRYPLHAAHTWRENIVLVRDPTDLVALPMGAVAAWIARAQPMPYRFSFS